MLQSAWALQINEMKKKMGNPFLPIYEMEDLLDSADAAATVEIPYLEKDMDDIKPSNER